MSRPESEPAFWRCKTCGCLWRDNHDNTVSLSGPTQKSCDVCEHQPTFVVCEPLFLQPVTSPLSTPKPRGKRCKDDDDVRIKRMEKQLSVLRESVLAYDAAFHSGNSCDKEYAAMVKAANELNTGGLHRPGNVDGNSVS